MMWFWLESAVQGNGRFRVTCLIHFGLAQARSLIRLSSYNAMDQKFSILVPMPLLHANPNSSLPTTTSINPKPTDL